MTPLCSGRKSRANGPKPSWNVLNVDLEKVLVQLETRFDALYIQLLKGQLVEKLKLPWYARAYLAPVHCWLRARLRAKAKTYLEKELCKAGILVRPL